MEERPQKTHLSVSYNRGMHPSKLRRFDDVCVHREQFLSDEERRTHVASIGTVLERVLVCKMCIRDSLEALAHAVRVLRGVDLSEADLAHARAHLPDHLRMTFVVTDASGKELGAGKDLAYLQRSLASDANKAVRTAVRAALEEAGEKQARRNKRGRGPSGKATALGGDCLLFTSRRRSTRRPLPPRRSVERARVRGRERRPADQRPGAVARAD